MLPKTRLQLFAALCVLPLAVLLAACGSGDSLQRLSADATWRDAFETFSDSEQACIRDALGQDQLESVFQRGLLEESGAGAPWEVSIYRCLEPSVAHSLLFFFVSTVFRQSGIEVNDEMEECWARAISTFDAVEIVAADPVVEEEFLKQLWSCQEIPTASRPPEFDGGLTDLLRVIPLAEGTRTSVWYNHYARAREANGIETPGEDASDEALEQYTQELSSAGVAPGPWISGHTQHAAAQLEHRQYMGFDIGSVEQSILAGEPPNQLEAATGRMDPGATDRALAACAECPVPEIHEHLGVKFYSWGEDYTYDLEKKLQPPAYDAIGRGGRIAVLDSLVFRTLATANMRSLIETYHDTRQSLADDPDLALAAGEMERLGAYSVVLMGLNEDGDRGTDKYRVLGTGVARDSEGLLIILVFVYEGEDAAGHNVQVLQEWLAEGYSIVSGRSYTEHFPRSEVWSDGRALIAKLGTDSPSIWMDMVFNRDPLLLWGK